MPSKEKHEIKMMYAVYADGRKEPIVIDEIKDLSLEEAEPILEEHDFVKVTRCKDCKYQGKLFHADARRKDGGYFIYWCDLVDGYSHVCLDDDYCSYGERREDAD